MSTAVMGGQVNWLRTVHLTRMGLHRGRVCRYLPKGKCYFKVLTPAASFALQAVYGKGICVMHRATRAAHFELLDTPCWEWEYPAMAIRKRQVQTTDVQHLAAVESVIFSDMMSLIEHCCLRKYEDGTDRECGWFTIKVTGAAWVVQVKDPDSATSFSAVADTLDKALGTAALLLACDEAPWEPDQFLARMKAEKKKK